MRPKGVAATQLAIEPSIAAESSKSTFARENDSAVFDGFGVANPFWGSMPV